MLQSFRDNLKGTVATILVGLMIIPFALFGVDSLFLQSGSANEAAKVNGEVISEAELRQAIYLQKQQLLSRFGENAPAEFLTDERLRQPVLDQLIQRRLVSQQAKAGGMAISDQVLDELILGAEQFQQDGKFDMQRYSQMLRSMGYTPAGYKRLLEQDMLLTQFASGFTGSDFATSAELEYVASLAQQSRSFYYLTLPLAGSENGIEVSDEELQQYYQDNQGDFIAPEQVAVEYLDISPVDLVKDLEFSEQDLRQQYAQDVANFEANTERRAAHILLESTEEGRALAKQLLQRLSNGEDFAALAQEFSEDFSSSDSGGDLGFSSGDIFAESFESALAALKVGEISPVVETEDGLHIIKLLEEHGAEAPSFEQERDRIAATLKAAEAENAFVEMLNKLGDLTYNAENLAEAASELGIEAHTSGLFSRSGGDGVFANPQVLEAAFSEEVLRDGSTSDVIELGEARVVVLRLIQHVPSHTKEFDVVKADIQSLLKREKAKQALAQRGQTLIAKVTAGEEVEAVAKAEGLEWQVGLDTKRTDPKVNREVLAHVFAQPRPEEKPAVSGLHLANGDFVVVSLTKVTDGNLGTLAAAQQSSLARSLAGAAGGVSYAAYQALLTEQSDIEIRN